MGLPTHDDNLEGMGISISKDDGKDLVTDQKPCTMRAVTICICSVCRTDKLS